MRQTAKEVGKRANLDIKRRAGRTRPLGARAHHRALRAPAAQRRDPRHRVAGRSAAPRASRRSARSASSSRQEGNEVQLALSDDGGGLDIERIRDKAIEQGTAWSRRATLSEAEIADFIFQAGFSTARIGHARSPAAASAWTWCATKSAALGGRVELAFTRGQGTRFTIYLPLTLAVTQAVLVRAGSTIYAIPVGDGRAGAAADARSSSRNAYATRQTEWQDRRYPFHYLPHLLGRAPNRRPSRGASRRCCSCAAAPTRSRCTSTKCWAATRKSWSRRSARSCSASPASPARRCSASGEIVLIINPVQLALTRNGRWRPDAVREAPKLAAVARRSRPSWWSTIRSPCARSPGGCSSARAISWSRRATASTRWRSCRSSCPTSCWWTSKCRAWTAST